MKTKMNDDYSEIIHHASKLVYNKEKALFHHWCFLCSGEWQQKWPHLCEAG